MDVLIQRRCDFVITLLMKLKEVNNDLKQLGSSIELNSESFYKKAFEENRHKIEKDVSTYNSNCEKVSLLYNEIISRINKWYNFVKNTDEIKKLSFPLKFINNKRKLKGFINKANADISSITIENRFIREHISSWDHEIELMAVQLINEGNDYKDYLRLRKNKEEIITELKYLLPTVLYSRRIELDPDNPNKLIEQLGETAGC